MHACEQTSQIICFREHQSKGQTKGNQSKGTSEGYRESAVCSTCHKSGVRRLADLIKDSSVPHVVIKQLRFKRHDHSTRASLKTSTFGS
jgi:hypothetical protein